MIIPAICCCRFCLIGGAMLLVCSALYLLFEKPFMYRDWPQQWKESLTRYVGRAH